MFSKTRLLLVVTALTACVLLSCSENTVTPEGQGTADSRVDHVFYGVCTKATTYPPQPYEDVWVQLYLGEEQEYYQDWSEEDGEYAIGVDYSGPQGIPYLIIAFPPDPEYDWIKYEGTYYGGGKEINFAFHAHPTEP